MLDSGAQYIFGPVASRRLGRSLGVDLIPYKTSSFDCPYCEIGRTTNKTVERKEYVSSDQILHAVKRFLSETSTPPDYITLGGSGEPTLNSKISKIISEIKNLTSIPVAVLTNSSLFFLDAAKEGLLKADLMRMT